MPNKIKKLVHIFKGTLFPASQQMYCCIHCNKKDTLLLEHIPEPVLSCFYVSERVFVDRIVFTLLLKYRI